MTKAGGRKDAGGGPRALPRWFGPAVVIALAVLVSALRLYMVAAPPGGFHSFNEHFYLDLAAQYAEAGPLSAATDPVDLNNPPAYPLLAASLYSVAGSDIVGPRLVSILAGAVAVFLMYALGRTLFNERIAILAAAVFAFMPGVVLVGRNAQVDMLLVVFELGAMVLYAIAVRRDDPRFAVAAGAVLGLGLLTKLPALVVLVVLAVWNVWRTRSLGWLREPVTRWALVAFAFVGLPWYATLAVTRGLIGSQARIISTAGSAATGARFFTTLFPRQFWGLSSGVGLALATVGTFLAARKRTPADLFVLSGLIVHAAVFVPFHFHSYYLLPIAPFVALAAARALDALGARSVLAVTLAIALLVISLGFSSTTTLASKKWGHWTPANVTEDVVRMGADPSRTTLYVSQMMLSNDFGPGFARYSREVTSVPEPAAPGTVTRAGDRQLLLTPWNLTDLPLVAPARLEQYRVVIFGYAVYAEAGANLHWFDGPMWTAERVGGPLRFGLDVRSVGHPVWAYYEWSSE